LGNAYNSLGQYQRAIDLFEQSLEIKREIGDRHGEARSLWNLSRTYQLRGRFQRSRHYRHQAYRIWQALQLPLEALPLPELQKRLLRHVGDDWIEQQLKNEQKWAWLYDSWL
jgi:tetratricopeptide (TPR) repeat protein